MNVHGCFQLCETRLNYSRKIIVIALGTLPQRSMLHAEPIRTPRCKATSHDWCTNPQQNIHHTCAYVRPLYLLWQIKNFQGKKRTNVQLLMTYNSHFLHSLHESRVNIVSVPGFVALLTQYCSLLVLSSLHLKNGGWDSLYMPWVWIDFCLAHFSWFWLCHFQGAPDEGPLEHRGKRFSC